MLTNDKARIRTLMLFILHYIFTQYILICENMSYFQEQEVKKNWDLKRDTKIEQKIKERLDNSSKTKCKKVKNILDIASTAGSVYCVQQLYFLSSGGSLASCHILQHITRSKIYTSSPFTRVHNGLGTVLLFYLHVIRHFRDNSPKT